MSRTRSSNQINYSFKLFTACAMVLVVCGHLNDGSVGFGGPFDMFKPYCYQVAAFVFVSGYFYNPNNESNPMRYIFRKAKKFLIPLYCICFIYGCLWTVLKPALGMQYGGELSAYNVFVAPLTSGHQYSINLAMWFIAPLFFAEVANILLRSILSRIHSDKGSLYETVLFVFYLALGSIAIVVGGSDGLGAGWLVLLMRTLFFIACFGMGRFYRAVLERHDTASSSIYFAVVLTLQLVVIVALRGSYTYVPSWCRFPGGVLGTYVATMLAIAFLLRVCKLVGPVIGRSRVVLAIADNSFSIMCHHLFAFFLLNCALMLVSAYTPFLNSFDYAAFASEFGYMFAPYGCKQFALVYVSWGIAFSILVHLAWTKIWTLGKTAKGYFWTKTKNNSIV